MPPKKKAAEAAAPSASNPPPPEPTGGGVDAGGKTGADEGTQGAAKSNDKAAQTSAFAHAPHPFLETLGQQRRGSHGAIRSLDPDRAGGSRDVQGLHAPQHAGTSTIRSPRRGAAP